jgi:hypothetical protein
LQRCGRRPNQSSRISGIVPGAGLLSVVFYLRAIRWRRPADAVGLLVCAVLMTAAKTQHALLAFWGAILLVVNGSLAREPISPVPAWTIPHSNGRSPGG